MLEIMWAITSYIIVTVVTHGVQLEMMMVRDMRCQGYVWLLDNIIL